MLCGGPSDAEDPMTQIRDRRGEESYATCNQCSVPFLEGDEYLRVDMVHCYRNPGGLRESEEGDERARLCLECWKRIEDQ